MYHSWFACHMEVYSSCDDKVFHIALCSRDRGGMEEETGEENFIRTKKQWTKVDLKIAVLSMSRGRKPSKCKSQGDSVIQITGSTYFSGEELGHRCLICKSGE